MKVETIWKEYENILEKLERVREETLKNFEEAKTNTDKFLAECKKRGIKCVSIATYTDEIESARNWKQNWNYCDNMIFADERDKNGWPAIWKVAEMEGGKYSGGCGNSGQHQFNCTKFIEGVYRFKDGKWMKID